MAIIGHMFQYRLSKTKDGRLRYAPTLWVRLLCLVFAILLIIGSISAVGEEGFTLSIIFPAAFTVLLILVPLYRDEWIFDNSSERITCIFGLGPLVSRKVFAYDDIDQIEIRHFFKGIREGSTAIKPSWRNKEMAVLRIRMAGDFDESEAIEIVPAKRSGLSLERTANAIASYTGLPLDVDKAALEKGLMR